MEDPRRGDAVGRHVVRRQHHVRAGVAVKGEVPVAVRQFVDEGQRGVYLLVHREAAAVDAEVLKRLPQQVAEHIAADLADEGGFVSQLLQHGQHVAGRAAGADLKECIALLACAVRRKVDQQLAERNHVIHGFRLAFPRG